ncbi:MAG: prepilin-type N-terminal cleavage/methylation domain-containing protein [Gammaproteobacteria bacterium]|nr:prepilin-type N-terminal cleavage/methylation domain-containing protein [Gammaproteobacteria bacterium]MBU1731670.1 prepilin-type N-terminal cleavage/methylation domain-containing protein [Gammaproteobacteria bacterium]MBU1892494.1 prepilin-type N-terminal cleavage/methylation domain-containing protein [Gammaproteobacteria bacterium]
MVLYPFKLKSTQQGFSLLETSIVLVIIGLLLGGALKGQELITTAQVKNLISQQEGIKVAYLGFLDRYRKLPGDYASASVNIQGVAPNANGNNDGRIHAEEAIMVWDHLSHAGFINGSYVYSPSMVNDTTTPKNSYARYLQLIYDDVYSDPVTATVQLNLKTGNQIPVRVLAEVDRKIDDGYPQSGAFRFSTYAGGGIAPTEADCINTTTTPHSWNIAENASNCGGASIF